MSNEHGVRLKAHTLFTGRVLYFPTSHAKEHRLYILASKLFLLFLHMHAFVTISS